MRQPANLPLSPDQEIRLLAGRRALLRDNLKMLERTAAIYFSAKTNPDRWRWSEKKVAQYDAFCKSYLKVYKQLQNSLSLNEPKVTAEEMMASVVAANQIAVDTTVLLNNLSKHSAESAAPAEQKQLHAEKVQHVQRYQQKYQAAVASIPYVRRFGETISRFCGAALGFLEGALYGAVLGMFFTAPSGEPHTMLAGVIGGAAVGGIFGAIDSRYKLACFEKKPVEALNVKAAKLGSRAEQCFPAPKPPIVKKPVERREVVEHPADLYVAMKVL